jgi:hypothetical protein
MRNKLMMLGIVSLLTVGGTAFAQSGGTGSGSGTGTGSGSADTGTTYSDNTRDNDHDWGWVGLLGLAGLMGLKRREVTRDRDVRTTAPVSR